MKYSRKTNEDNITVYKSRHVSSSLRCSSQHFTSCAQADQSGLTFSSRGVPCFQEHKEIKYFSLNTFGVVLISSLPCRRAHGVRITNLARFPIPELGQVKPILHQLQCLIMQVFMDFLRTHRLITISSGSEETSRDPFSRPATSDFDADEPPCERRPGTLRFSKAAIGHGLNEALFYSVSKKLCPDIFWFIIADFFGS